MDTVVFLEKLACNAHHHNEINELIMMQPEDVKTAISQNKAEELKRVISPNTTYYADKTGVVRA